MNRQDAYIAIAAVEGVALQLAAATSEETRLADLRSLEKDAAIRRLMASGTYTSVTAAEKYVEADPEFLAHRQREREAVATRIVIQGKLEAAKLRARLAVEHWALDPRDLSEADEQDGPSLEDYKREALRNEGVIERIAKLLDDAGVIQRADEYGAPGAGPLLDVEKRIEILLARPSRYYEGTVKHGHVDVDVDVFPEGSTVQLVHVF